MARRTATPNDQTTLELTTAAPESEAAAAAAAVPTTAIPVHAVALPPLEAPAINPSEPGRSYKIDFSDRTSWHASEDNGKTKAATGSPYVAGAVCDFCLLVTEAKDRGGYDYRFRLAFYEPDGMLCELNLNAVNLSREAQQPYVTSPVRSLVGALLVISESEEDMAAFCAGSRFHVTPGRGKGVFVGVDIALGANWVAMGSAVATQQVAKEPDGLAVQLELIKHRFRASSLLLTSAAVLGMPVEDDESNAVDATATAVDG